MLTAWGDESGSQPLRDPHTYLMAAALCEEGDVLEWRKTMLDLLLPGEKKVHWHASSDNRRHDLIDAVAALPMAGLVVVHTEDGSSDRRHRRKCLEFLLPNLAEMPCTHITLESRIRERGSPAQNSLSPVSTVLKRTRSARLTPCATSGASGASAKLEAYREGDHPPETPRRTP